MRNQRSMSLCTVAGVGLVASLVGLGAPPANAESGAGQSWPHPVTLGKGYAPSLAVGHGTTTVAWNTTGKWAEGEIRVRRHVAGKGWGPTIQIGSGGSVAVAASRSNVTVAAWFQAAEPDTSYRVMAARRTPGGRWGNPEALGEVPFPRIPNDLEVAVSDSGAAVVSWMEEIDDEVETVRGCATGKNWSFVAYSTPSGVWESPHSLISRRCYMETHVAIGRRGNAVVAYTHRGVQLTRRIIGRGWTAPRTITRDFAFKLHVMRTPGGGRLVVAWEGGTNKDWKYAARRRTNGLWGPVQIWKQLPPFPRSADYYWGAAMDGLGNSTLAVLGRGSVQVMPWPRTESIGAESTIVDRTTAADGIDIATGASGDTVVSFFAFSQARRTELLHTLYRPRGGPWGPDQVLTGPDYSAGFYHLAVRPSGGVDAVWDEPGTRGSPAVIRHTRLARD